MAIGNRIENPPPILNMGVDIQPTWTQLFWDLSKQLNLSHKETINWVVDKWFSDSALQYLSDSHSSENADQ